jgi:hypothetical protein
VQLHGNEEQSSLVQKNVFSSLAMDPSYARSGYHGLCDSRDDRISHIEPSADPRMTT